MKPHVVILIFMLIIPGLTAIAQIVHRQQVKKNITEKEALSLISALPEVKQFMRHARKEKPMLQLENDPDSTNKYYRIAEGISNFDMFRTSTSYFVDANTGEIFIDDGWDNSTDELFHMIPLELNRRWRSDPRFHHFHTFKNGKLVVLDSKGKATHGTNKSSRHQQKEANY